MTEQRADSYAPRVTLFHHSRHVLGLTCLVAVAVSGCSSEVASSPVVPLVFVPEAEHERTLACGLDNKAATDDALVAELSKDLPTAHLGAAF